MRFTTRKVRVVQKLPTPLRHVGGGEATMVKTMQRGELRTRKRLTRRASKKSQTLPAEFSWNRYADTRLQQIEEAGAEDGVRHLKCSY
jgi:hypothetical protein